MGSASAKPITPCTPWGLVGFAQRSTHPTTENETVAGASASAVAQKLAGQRAGRLAVLKGDLTVDQDPVVALGFLDPPPLAAGQVFGHFRGQNLQLVEVIDHDVGRRLLAYRATVFEAAH